jgi:hypothetical protein
MDIYDNLAKVKLFDSALILKAKSQNGIAAT